MSVLQKIFDASAAAANKFDSIREREHNVLLRKVDEMAKIIDDPNCIIVDGRREQAAELAVKPFAALCMLTAAIAEKAIRRPLVTSKLKI